jgi:signal transduction histidine kinase
MSSVQEERAFWAHQLHAKVLNTLGAVILQSHVCERAVRDGLASSADEVTRLKQMLVDLEDTTRSLLTVPLSSSTGHLGEDIQGWVVRLNGRHSGASISCNVRGTESRVPARISLGVTGILVEAISNSLRHGNPTSIEVDLSFMGAALLLRIRDDGRGFDLRSLLETDNVPAPGQHLGVASMRQLAEMIGANFAISSAPGRGTQISVYASWAKKSRVTASKG